MEIRCRMSKFCQRPAQERKAKAKAVLALAFVALAYIIAGTIEFHLLGM